MTNPALGTKKQSSGRGSWAPGLGFGTNQLKTQDIIWDHTSDQYIRREQLDSDFRHTLQ